MRTTWLLLLSSMLVLTACGDDAGSEDGGLSGDGDGDGDGGMPGDGDGDGDGDGECDGPNGREVVGATDDLLFDLSVAADDVVFISRDAALAGPTSIEAIGHDGENRRTLFESTGERTVVSAIVHGEDVLFLEENEEIVARLELFRVPIAGGEAERIGTNSVAEGDLFGVDDTHAFIVANMDSPLGALFRRIDLESGEIEVIGTLEAVGTPLHVSLSDDLILFYAGYAGSRAGEPAEVWGLPKDSTDATAESLWVIDVDDLCGFPQAGLFATPTKIACGYSAVVVRDRDGQNPETLVERDIVNEQNVLVATDGETLYMIERSSPTADTKVQMKRMESSGGAREPVVCDLGAVAYQTRDGFFPDQTAYEVSVGESEVFWIESSFADETTSFVIRAGVK